MAKQQPPTQQPPAPMEAAASKPAKYKFANGEKTMRHPVLGVITEEHLNAADGHVMKAIAKMDERKETKNWQAQFIAKA